MVEMISDWNDLKLFLFVARHKGLSGAAREAGLSAATLGRRMQALEQATGIEIFHRHARGYDLTERGEALLARVAALDADVRPIFARDQSHAQTLVKFSGGHWTLHALAPHVPSICQAAPNAMLRLISATDGSLPRRHRRAGLRTDLIYRSSWKPMLHGSQKTWQSKVWEELFCPLSSVTVHRTLFRCIQQSLNLIMNNGWSAMTRTDLFLRSGRCWMRATVR